MQPSLWSNSHICIWLLEKPYLWLCRPLSAKWCFCILIQSKFAITFLPKSKHLLILWLWSPSAVILEPRKMKSVTVSTFCPSICHEVIGSDAMILVFWMLIFKPVFSLSSFTFIRSLFSSFSLSAFKVVSFAYLRLWIFLPAILIPVCASSSTAFLMMYFALQLNEQGDHIQTWHTPYPILNQSIVSCPVITVVSWPAYMFLRRQLRWYGISLSSRMFHSLLWSTQSKALVWSLKQKCVYVCVYIYIYIYFFF